MSYAEDPRIFDAKRMSIRRVVDILKITGLHETSGELSGPCPRCGGHDKRGSNRFNVNLTSNLFLCRQCGIKGNDQIGLVREVLQVGFLEALDVLCGAAPVSVSPQELEKRCKLQARQDRRKQDYATRARKRAKRDARRIWQAASAGQGAAVLRSYLDLRGLTADLLPQIPPALRFAVELQYVKMIDGETRDLYSGPAMVAVIQGPDGIGSAVHRTWLDLSQANGKAVITYRGEQLGAKMVRGSKRGGAIRLHSPQGADTLVMGEGIETTLTAMAAKPFKKAAFWAGVDLGNMAGRMLRIKGMRYSGEPDMDDDRAFVPPRWVRRLIYIMDGDSEPKMTRAKLECGLKRAMALRPGLEGLIVPAGHGRDLNDILNPSDQPAQT